MSEPTRFQYRSHRAVPATAVLLDSVTRSRHLVLEFPRRRKSSPAKIVERLRRDLPENYVTFDSGGSTDTVWATIMQVVSTESVLKSKDELVDAATDFRNTATDLATALAAFNDIPLPKLWESCRDLRIHSPDWRLDVHGVHSCFIHEHTGQTVEVHMGFGTECGVLDPYFFYDYMKTTPGLTPPTELMEPFHDTSRAMEILEDRGRLFRISGLYGSSGLTARNPNQQG